MDLYYEEISNILQQTSMITEIKQKIISFSSRANVKQNLFIYGESGVGKTFLIKKIIKDLGHDILYYNNIDVRNKTAMDNISSEFKGNQNVIQLFHKIKKKIVIVMDDVEHMSNGDKTGIASLTKIVRCKKTKKQQTEESSVNQIICITNSILDKKIKELANGCIQFKLTRPTKAQMTKIINLIMPDKITFLAHILNYTNTNIQKLNSLYTIYIKNKELICDSFFNNVRNNYSSTENKLFTKNIINMNNDNYSLNELDKNVIGLIWHENIVDVFSKLPQSKWLPLYIYFLQNICFADYIDKFIFQKQIWQLTDLTFLIKVVKNMNFYKEFLTKNQQCTLTDVRFTKILTKYSTEYNNYIFLKEFCQNMLIDKNDLFSYFLKNKNVKIETLITTLEKYDVCSLNINRIFKFLDKLLIE
uniref:AAA+ ATPase domain-containing protein n=1 Tax=viral metagenome TaxID=1070528 RepID=A0A6C0HRZ9_9ZZZZ